MTYYLLTLAALSLISCAESKFSAGTPAPAGAPISYSSGDAAPAPVPAPVVTPSPVSCAPESIVKRAFPAEVNTCYESGRVWNFGSNECVQMRAAAFTCDWANVTSELKKIGLQSSSVDKASANPLARLVGCGQSQDKMRIVVQWITLPQADTMCGEVKGSGAVTGCFTNYGSKDPPAPPENQAEQDKRTYECMNL